MKKCPTCGNTFDDNMRFCQVDGTPLVEEEPAAPVPPPAEEAPFDPYATIVGVPKSAMPPSTPPEASVEPASPQSAGSATLEPIAGSGTEQTASSIPVAPPDDILDLGGDPLKTMYVSDAEMKEVLGTASQGSETPAEEIRADEAQSESSFDVPSAPPSPFDSAPPPSRFSPSTDADQIPVPAPPSFLGSDQVGFDDAATMIQPNPGMSGPSEPPQSQPQEWAPPPPPPQQMQQQEWAPPPAPTPEWQNQPIGSNTPFQPPPAGAAGGQNKTLAIISMVSGILSCLCCVSIITGPLGAILGYMAKKKVAENPAEYGGEGMATAGMITGIIGTLLAVVLIILQVFFGALNTVLR